jgi:DeoR family fructose operon transcriptional repressor
MLAPERHRQILRLLQEQGRLALGDAAAHLGVSLPTVRRDFAHLATLGQARRAHGALLPGDFGLAEPRYSRKAERAVALKSRLGRAVAALLPEAGSVFVDSGTTALEVGRALLDRPGLRIHTNSLPLLCLAPEARATLVSLGGEVRPLGLSLTGGLAQHWLQNLRFDAAVLGASGLDPAEGASTTETSEAALKTEALRRSARRVLVVHGEKWGRPSALRFAPWSAFTDLVTDHAFTRAERVALGREGLRLHGPTS